MALLANPGSTGVVLGQRRSPAPSTRRKRHLTRTAASSADQAAESPAAVHDGRLPFLQTLQQFASPQQYSAQVLRANRFAWGRTSLPPVDTLFVADTTTLRSWLNSESQLGIKTEWPETFRVLLGEQSVSMVQDADLHARLRQVIAPHFSPEAVAKMMPGIQATVRKHLTRWAAAGGPVGGYMSAKLLTFDVITNQALAMNMSDEEVAHYSHTFKVFTDGFMPPAINLPIFPFGRGLRAREALMQRSRQALAQPDLPPDSLLARFRQEWGADSEVATSNVVNLLFAGHDTSSTAIAYMMWQLARHPDVMQQLRAEQAVVLQQHGPELTPAASADMPFTTATAREVLRLAQVVAYVPRTATKPLAAPGDGPSVPSGCPFIIALSSISASDPAVSGDAESFRPERWLQPEHAKSLQQMQLPFGVGQHYCLGSGLAMAELTAVLAELACSWQLSADTDTTWTDFPIKRPNNGLPITLQPLGTAAAAESRVGAAAAH